MFKKKVKHVQYGKDILVLETGEMARQATSSVLVKMNETIVLVTVTANKEVKEGQGFFPLAVDYFEKNYANGRIPGGFIKREGKASDNEVLIARLIDRSLRPLFPDSLYNEIHIIAQVLSLNPDVSPDVLAIIGASAALSLSGLPFKGPIGAARVGYIDEQFVLNPSMEELKNSQLDLIVSGTENAIIVVEAEAKELTEETMLSAIMYGHEQFQNVVKAINDLTQEVNPILWKWDEPVFNQDLINKITELAYQSLIEAFAIRQKALRVEKLKEIKKLVIENLVSEETDLNTVNAYLFDLEAKIVRDKILNGEPRIDGRDTRSVRPIDIQTSILPRVHGSSLFTRGETQVLAIATLGTKSDEQLIDSIRGSYLEKFILHYNFPPFSTGEAGRMGPPKRREIGHGNLARRALRAVLPDTEDFPYTIRVVSEVLESNGSSSMASVCGSCMAMMDAGIPIKKHVAGVAMGLILKQNKFAILTDILADEDHLGDMDFKVAGTEEGITALQMDIKINGITKGVMQIALQQAKDGRLHILSFMKESLPYPRVLSERVPKLYNLKISPEKIKDVIGRGGAVIKSIIAESGATIDISDDGMVTIASANRGGAERARAMIENIVAEAKIGEIYEGIVTRILDKNMGAMVSILGGREGFVHISQIVHERVSNVSEFLKEGQAVRVKVVEFDDRGRMRLSIKAAITFT